ncbi:MAG: hypothetical protein Ct9H300mP25_04820 [Acidobacteriota bacterium]|nr:MAG: hypothetical protein Ct9H300mP25_04820 [Acidobacteriota bacterium]
MLLEAIHVDGRREVLTDVTNYEQTWQIVYPYKEAHLFPKGTILHTVSWHDNTAKTNTIPIRQPGWVGVVGQWMKWAMAGRTLLL